MDELKKKTIAALEQQLQLLAQNGGSPAGKAETCNAITVLTALLLFTSPHIDTIIIRGE